MGDAPDIITEPAADAEDVIDRLEAAIADLSDAAKSLATHGGKMLEAVTRLEPLLAAREIPEATKDVIEDVASTTSNVTGAGAAAVKTVPAAATGALDDTRPALARLRKGLRGRRG